MVSFILVSRWGIVESFIVYRTLSILKIVSLLESREISALNEAIVIMEQHQVMFTNGELLLKGDSI